MLYENAANVREIFSSGAHVRDSFMFATITKCRSTEMLFQKFTAYLQNICFEETSN